MWRLRMFWSFIGRPSFTLWKTTASGSSDLTSLYSLVETPALISTVRVLRRRMRVITCGETPIVAALASDFGCDQSPRQYRSSMEMESRLMHLQRRPINSETRRPVHTATYSMLAYGSATSCTRALNCSGVIVGLRRRPRLSLGSRNPSNGLLTRKSGTADRRMLESASRTFTMEGYGIARVEKYRCRVRGVKSRRQRVPKVGTRYFPITPL